MPDAVQYKVTRQKEHRHGSVFKCGVLFSSLLF